jgi:hypothetical protein
MVENPARAYDMSPEQEARWEVPYAEARLKLESGDGAAALRAARTAWEAIPEPKILCSLSYVTLMRMVRAFLAAREFDDGIEVVEWVLDNNPFERQIPVFWVQKGILQYESGRLDDARVSFAKAWAIAKDFGFKSEDPKYLEFHRSKA